MNDFTIQELVLLACWSVNRSAQVGMDQSFEEGTISLTHKIQEMIINYCEHESDGNIYWSNPPKSKCTKCGKLFR
jgi:hypothetical protein